MTPSTQIGIFAPPVMAVLGFLMSWGKARDGYGVVGKEKAAFLIRMWLVMMLVGYGLLWYKEIVALIF